MRDKLKRLKSRYEELTGQISDSEIIADHERWQKLVKEHSDIEPIIVRLPL